MKTYIYALVNPEDESVFYIGKSNNPEQRMTSHMALSSQDKNRHKKSKIKKIKQNGFVPELKILETCNNNDWKNREKHWIEKGKKLGWPLTNIVNGGEGSENSYMYHVVYPYLNPTRDDFVNAINDIIHPRNHKSVKTLNFDNAVKLGKCLALHLLNST